MKPTDPSPFDRDIFLLVVVIGLALSVNILGLMGLIEKHVTVSPSLRILAYIAALTSGGFVGLFSRRITSRITTWRDQK